MPGFRNSSQALAGNPFDPPKSPFINDLDTYEELISSTSTMSTTNNTLIAPISSNSFSVKTTDGCSFGDLGFNKLY